ncbi:flagellar basal-body rod protein FlgG, partial [Pseudorhodobacter sp.]|uniref:flagellar basal-body rod protein FlgG n=1 Tax=Pseudorhodobacter sp. TaxID=1934400 RepID=UPI002649B8DB
ANMSTTGYNARRAEFTDLHYQQLARPGTISAQDGAMLPTGVQLGLGVRAASVSVILAQGSLSATGGDLDVAIEGKGYLEVTLPSGETAYTRDGGLKRTGDGLIVNSEGFQVNPGITIPADARSVAINAEGEVYAYFAGQVQPQLMGQLSLTGFTNDKGLEAIGSNLFLETAASGPPQQGTAGQDGLGSLRQGYLEESSVDAVREVTELIKAQRGYELNAKVITAADQMLSAATQLR